MIKYVVKTTDGSLSRYNNVYCDVETGGTGVVFIYSTGTKIFYPYNNIIWMKTEEVDDDECD